MNLLEILYLPGYVLFFLAILSAVMWWERRRRRRKRPFPEDLKLLRMPGEHLWRRVIENDEADTIWFLGIMLVPILIGGGMLQITAKFFPSSPLLVWLLTIGAFVISLTCCVRWCQRRLQRRADDYLGFFGERYVAEWLEPLKTEGWFIEPPRLSELQIEWFFLNPSESSIWYFMKGGITATSFNFWLGRRDDAFG